MQPQFATVQAQALAADILTTLPVGYRIISFSTENVSELVSVQLAANFANPAGAAFTYGFVAFGYDVGPTLRFDEAQNQFVVVPVNNLEVGNGPFYQQTVDFRGMCFPGFGRGKPLAMYAGMSAVDPATYITAIANYVYQIKP